MNGLVAPGAEDGAAQDGPPEAFDRALDVFWRRGYEGATLDELTAAMVINRPSLYAVFGNKQGLFERAVDRYAAGPAAYATRALAEPTARRVVEALFDGAVNQAGCPGAPGGCLVVHGALAAGTLARYVATVLHGLAVQAAGGATADELRAWPA